MTAIQARMIGTASRRIVRAMNAGPSTKAACLTVSRAGSAAIAAPDSIAASSVRSMSDGVMNGRAASCTITYSLPAAT